jgi:tetratricopeptide (TPR) repeat protein
MKQLLSFCFMICLLLPQAVSAQYKGRNVPPKIQADSLNRLGTTYNEKGNHYKAEPLFLKAIAICRKHKLNKELGQSLYNLSSLYTVTANYETAIKLGEEAVGLLLQYNDKDTNANCLMNLEICWRKHGVFINAMSYADSAVKALRPLKNDRLLELALWRQGEIYREINTVRAIPMFKEALALAKKIPELHNLDNIYNSLGQCYIDDYMETYNPATAEYYFLMAVNAAIAYDKKEVNDNRIQYGKICISNGKYTEAQRQLKLVYDDANAAHNTDDLSVAAFCLSEVYFGMKDFATAYRYLKQHESLEERYYATQKKGTTDKMAFNFKTKRVETQNKLLKQERELKRVKQERESFRKNVKIGISVAVMLFLVVVTVMLVKFFKKKNILLSKRGDTLRQQLLLTQMSPHFITSSISSIQNLIRDEKPDVAATYLLKFARLTRQILENSTGEYIALEEEIAMITNYLTVQQLLYPGGFNFTVDDDDLEAEAIYIAPMLTQPLIANAVKRVTEANGDERRIDVKFLIKNNKLLFEVSDSGGFLKTRELEDILKSQEVSITQERLGNTQINIRNNDSSGITSGFEIAYISDD